MENKTVLAAVIVRGKRFEIFVPGEVDTRFQGNAVYRVEGIVVDPQTYRDVLETVRSAS